MAEVVNLNMFGGETPQVNTMPTPSAELAGKILQYAGETDGNFTAGYFYKCVTADGVSSWQRVNVQPSAAGISWGGIDGDIGDQTDLAAVLNAKIGKMNVTFVVDIPEQLAIKTAAAGNTAIVKTTGKLHTYGSEAWDGGVNGEYGVIYLGEAEQYIWDTTRFVLVSTEDAKTLNGKSESYFAKESEVAKKDGRYPLMNVGSADNLTGGMKVLREFTEDTAGGGADITNGIVQVERIKGNSIVWRNLIPRMRVVDGAIENWLFSGATNILVTETSDEISFTNALSCQPLALYYGTIIIGRKYYWLVRVKSNNANNYVFCSPLKGGTVNTYGVVDEFVTISEFRVAVKDWGFNGIRFSQEVHSNTTTIDKRIGMVLIDVSSIEESIGKEFQTKSDFESWLAHSGFENYFGYSAGEIFNLNPTAIKTIGFNAYNHATGKAYVIGGNQYQITGTYTSITEDGVSITPDTNGKFTPTKNGELVIAGGDSTTTCVHLVWSGKRDGEYEEYWEETCNIPVAQVNTDGTITESVEGKTRLFPDGLCSVGEYTDEVTPVKAIKRIRTRAYEEGDEEDISILTDGTTTLYALATPVVVEFTEPLNLNYHVSDFGTETLLPINGATPVTTAIKMDVEYSLNIVDTVRNLSRNYLGITGTQNTFAVIASTLAAYGISMTLGDYDETNKYYPVTISGGWKPASAAPASATAAGSKGEYYIDAEYFYVCVDDATWKRFALSSW